MFHTILIANRGEIACRIMQTAQGMGLACVAVYSDADATAKHVAMADKAVHIGGAAPSDSYLRGDVIIQAALDTRAQAIHPGYGFLSENPDFVEAVEAAGLVFIGPSADAIRAMGLKDAAKALMVEAGVPVVPGYHGADQSDTLLAAEAEKIGYPVLIKAVAGGGGKGMRLVENASDFPSALASARSEAHTAFGNSDVLVEKYVSKPRHIEVQIFGDGTRAIHLFERDCSLQRRHQKVIEEAPAPGMTQQMRDAMGQAAVRAAEAIAYAGAGTVEFIVDASEGLQPDRFYFMEMNTRLQVEHPVTELVTGVDLVELQLNVAAGQSLQISQNDLQINGHAFEARLYAEDVPRGFLPATGRLAHLKFPRDPRADSGVRAGDGVSPYYDPMIAKLVVHGPTREVALRKMSKALRETQVAGTVTNLAFLGALIEDERFVTGDVDTGLIASRLSDLTCPPSVEPRHWVAAAMAGLNLREGTELMGFSLWGGLKQHHVLRCGDEDQDLTLQVLSRTRQVWGVGTAELVADYANGRWQIAGQVAPDCVVRGSQVTVFDLYGLTFELNDPLNRNDKISGDGSIIEAPMPGLVRSISTQAGTRVAKGEVLAVLEAMKMEHTLLAARDGVVEEVLAAMGDQVEAGMALIRLVAQE